MPYTTWGPIRGGCGHAHRTIEAARRCVEKDVRTHRRRGGFSDRLVVFIEARSCLASYDVTRGPGRWAGSA